MRKYIIVLLVILIGIEAEAAYNKNNCIVYYPKTEIFLGAQYGTTYGLGGYIQINTKDKFNINKSYIKYNTGFDYWRDILCIKYLKNNVNDNVFIICK